MPAPLTGPSYERCVRPEFWRRGPVSWNFPGTTGSVANEDILPKWEWMSLSSSAEGTYPLPDSDLMTTLVGSFFEHLSVDLPVLHRPIFMQQLNQMQHQHDPTFLKLLLLVCALGARLCDDPRVCATSPAGEVEWGSAGWTYFVEAHQDRCNWVFCPS